MPRLRPCLLVLALLTAVPQHAVPQTQPSSQTASASAQHKPKKVTRPVITTAIPPTVQARELLDLKIAQQLRREQQPNAGMGRTV